jgi:hypothetical protein
VQVLEYVNGQAAGTNSSGSGLWEAQAVLLLWLSILILIPFDLVILDSSVTDGSTAAGQAGYPPLAAKIMAVCQGFLSQPGRPFVMAALTCRRIAHYLHCKTAAVCWRCEASCDRLDLHIATWDWHSVQACTIFRALVEHAGHKTSGCRLVRFVTPGHSCYCLMYCPF